MRLFCRATLGTTNHLYCCGSNGFRQGVLSISEIANFSFSPSVVVTMICSSVLSFCEIITTSLHSSCDDTTSTSAPAKSRKASSTSNSGEHFIITPQRAISSRRGFSATISGEHSSKRTNFSPRIPRLAGSAYIQSNCSAHSAIYSSAEAAITVIFSAPSRLKFSRATSASTSSRSMVTTLSKLFDR